MLTHGAVTKGQAPTSGTKSRHVEVLSDHARRPCRCGVARVRQRIRPSGRGRVNKKVDALGQASKKRRANQKRNGARFPTSTEARAAQGSADQARQAASAAGNDARAAASRANEVGVRTERWTKASKRQV
jgi:hypothetical protein